MTTYFLFFQESFSHNFGDRASVVGAHPKLELGRVLSASVRQRLRRNFQDRYSHCYPWIRTCGQDSPVASPVPSSPLRVQTQDCHGSKLALSLKWGLTAYQEAQQSPRSDAVFSPSQCPRLDPVCVATIQLQHPLLTGHSDFVSDLV